MPDVQVDAAAFTIHRGVLGMMVPGWIDQNIVYDFFLTDTENLVLRKSLNRGLTYGAQTPVFAGGANDVVKAVNWYDRWTADDTGRFMHFFTIGRDAIGGTQRIEYRNLDTRTDVFTVPVAIGAGGGTVDSTRNWDESCIALTKTRAGNLYAGGWINSAAGANWLLRSSDNGVTWTAVGVLASPATPDWVVGTFVDRIIFMPGNFDDPDDFYCIYIDQSTRELSWLTYDASANTWSETQTGFTLTALDPNYFQFMAGPRHSDGRIIVPCWSQIDNPTADLVVFEIASASVSTQLTNVWTNKAIAGDVSLTIDQISGALYVGYLEGGTWQSLVATAYKVSGDRGVTWGSSITFSEDADDDHRWVRSAISVTDGSFALFWHNFDLLAVFTNVNNTIAIAPGIVPAVCVTVPTGGTYGPAPGAPPGTILYVTPDGIEYPLVTPHQTGRYVMSFSGFGSAPIQYITQRGPNQDGETVRDFNLTPRVVQLLERHQFRDRGAWWDGRAAILNDLRPNRQLTATAVARGVLRIVTANGDVRDLNVFIQDGPRFEARNVDAWDEWAFEEVLRFIAHDPLWFNPTRVDLTLAFSLASDLVFPITFPIQFGSGDIDVSVNLDYVGTWASLPVIVIVGPIEDLIIDNVTTGETLRLLQNIGPARTVTIDLSFGQKTIIDDLGNNLLGSLSTDSDLGTWHIAPTPEAPQVTGQPRPTARNVIRLRGSNPTGTTSVQVRYFNRYFGI